MSACATSVISAIVCVGVAVGAAAQTCPVNSADARTVRLEFAAGAGRSMGTRALAGGGIPLTQCTSLSGSISAVGYVNYYPDFHLFYNSQNLGRGLEIRVVGDCDTTLLVNGATGDWHFNDDANRENPGIRFNNAFSGRYDIFVGTYGTDFCGANLVVESY